MYMFHVSMKMICDIGLFKGMKIPNIDITISHLFYMDDALFIGEWNKSNIKNLAQVIRCFHVFTELKLNFHKSRMFSIGVSL